MSREVIERNTKVAIAITEKMKKGRNDLKKAKEKIIQLDKQGELTILLIVHLKEILKDGLAFMLDLKINQLI